MSTYKNLMTVCCAAVLALGLAACGGGGSDTPTASTSPTPASEPAPEPTPTSGTVADIPQTTGLVKALMAVFADDQTMGELVIPAGQTRRRGGVAFTCAGDVDCTITTTVTRDADGNITDVSAEWSGGEVTATFIDPLENMNEANEAKIAAIMARPMDAAAIAANPTADPPVVGQPAGADDGAQLGGLKSGGTIGTAESVENAGADNINGVTLTGGMDDPNNAGTPLGRSFDPNVAVSTLRAMADDSDPPNPSNDIGDMQAGALGLMGWSHKVLHADWGDTAGGLDAGIETAALIYSNMEAKSVAFNTLSTVLVNADLRAWFALTMNFGTGQAMDADDATDDPNNAVDIADAAADGAATQVANALISPSGQTFAGLVAHPDANDVVLGHYFGVSGQFKCLGDACQISRDTGGATPFQLSAGRWLFVPDDAEAMVVIPDQDWVAFGVWLTAPDNMADGVHDIGVFYDGMETYAGQTTVADGTATFEGKAAGYYVNGTEHGLFTADASLTAIFDDTNGDMLSGSIQNFRDSQGRYIDSDNPGTPNDPNQGGENDWGVMLESTAFNGTGGVAGGTTSGTADGVMWSGDWNAQLYGPGGRKDPVELPTGVAGNFRAITGELTGGGYKGVLGAFGAQAQPMMEMPADDGN